jgi:tetratricopeptide (TPR) repeat protein
MPRSLVPVSVSLVLSAAFSLAACDRGASDSSPEGAPAEAKPAADAGEAKSAADKPVSADAAADAGEAKPAAKPGGEAKPKPNSFKAPTREEAVEHKKSLQAHLDAGRKAVKAKDYETGITELEAAVAINPFHGKSLGELGWAYFNAGKLDQAQARLELALKYADNDASRGAVLYNLGRVAEAKADVALAIELYTRSLAVRPNDTVAARLSTLGGTPPAPNAVLATTHSTCGFERKGPPPAHLCWAELLELGQDVNDPSADDNNYACEYGRTELDAAGGAVSAGGEATVYDLTLDGGKVMATVYSYRDFEDYVEVFVLAVVVDGVLYTAPLTSVGHPGVGYADENLNSVTLRAEDLIPGGRPELIVEWDIQGHDMDPGIDEEELWSSKHIAVVSVDGPPQWLAALTTEFERSHGAMGSWAGEMIEDSPPPTDVTRKGVKVSWADGKVSVVANGEASAPVGSFAIGEYPIRCANELFGY